MDVHRVYGRDVESCSGRKFVCGMIINVITEESGLRSLHLRSTTTMLEIFCYMKTRKNNLVQYCIYIGLVLLKSTKTMRIIMAFVNRL